MNGRVNKAFLMPASHPTSSRGRSTKQMRCSNTGSSDGKSTPHLHVCHSRSRYQVSVTQGCHRLKCCSRLHICSDKLPEVRLDLIIGRRRMGS